MLFIPVHTHTFHCVTCIVGHLVQITTLTKRGFMHYSIGLLYFKHGHIRVDMNKIMQMNLLISVVLLLNLSSRVVNELTLTKTLFEVNHESCLSKP